MSILLSKQETLLCAGAFMSTFLFVFGTLLIVLIGWPVVASMLTAQPSHTPQLPLSKDREEELFDIRKNRGTQLYPALTITDPTTYTGNTRNWIRIPSINVTTPLVMSPSMDDSDIISTLNHGAALYPNGVEPGRLGNIFIAAHSTGEPWKGKYRFAFLRINELTPGNVIHIDYENTRYTYRVTDKEIIVPTGDVKVVSNRPVPTMTLMACWPLWSTRQRMLVRGELTNITQLTQKPSV